MDLCGLPYSLESMRLSDVPAISSLERQVFTTPWSPEAFRQELTFHEEATYFVLRYTNRESLEARYMPRPWSGNHEGIVGYGGVWRILEEAHVSTLAVRPQWRGRGLGELLFAALLERAIESKASEMTLEVRVTNQTAQNLYAKYGLRVVGRRPRYYPDNQEDAWIMCSPPLQEEAYRQVFADLVQRLLLRIRHGPHAIPESSQA